MVSYTEKEMIGITELGKKLNSVVEEISSNAIEKIAIFKSNKPKVVMLSFSEYQRIKELADMFEHNEIANIVDERVPNGKFKSADFNLEKYNEKRLSRRNV